MSTWNPDQDVLLTDSDDDEENFSQRDFKGREALLFVVDANLSADPARLDEALEIIRMAFISGLLISDKDLLGVVFANTAHSPDPIEPNCLENIVLPEHCAVFLPPRQLTKSIVEHLLRFIGTTHERFANDYGIAPNGGCGSFAFTIRLCLNLLESCGYALNNASIVYMTDRETPHPPHTHEYQMALQKAKDLEGKEVEFHVIPMVDEFDYDCFYKEFLTLASDNEMDAFIPPDAEQLREILANRKLKQDFKKRCLGHFTFSLGPKLSLSATYYNYFNKRGYPRKVKLLRADNSIVRQHRVIIVAKKDGDTMETIDERQIKHNDGWYEMSWGQHTIRVTPEQVNRVRNLHAPGMMLLGFKPRAALPERFLYRPCNFMYPDDATVVGSKRLFRALWERCMARQRIAVCLFMCKRKSHPRYVALVPVAAKDNPDAKGARALLTGDGFKIVYLPPVDDVTDVDVDRVLADAVGPTGTEGDEEEPKALAKIPEEGVKVMKKVIRKLRFKYHPNMVGDQTLERLQADLLALGLNIKTENAGESNLPSAEAQDECIAELLPQFEELFGRDPEFAAKKRGATASAEGRRPAKVARLTADSIKDYDRVVEVIKAKDLDALTLTQLRFILDEHFGVKMPRGIPKQSLLDRIYVLHEQC